MSELPENYKEILAQLKEKIRVARTRAVYSVNSQLFGIYWEIGRTILDQQEKEGWGTKVVDRLSSDLKSEFTDMKGLSVRNLKYMRAFAEAYSNYKALTEKVQNHTEFKSSEIVQVPPAQIAGRAMNQFVQEHLAQLSWYHLTTLLDKVKETEARNFYILKTIESGWSRNVMVHQIEMELYKRQGKIQSNFETAIAPPNSELVQQVFKDPYKFEFIYLGQEATERDLEDALTNQVTKFLLELGQWFSFMGRQYKINLGDKEYFFDLLFYHTRLKRYIVIELKIDEFKPEYKGKMEFYLNLADDYLKDKDDNPSIGLILCKEKDGLVVKYALRDSKKPIGVAQYHISSKLPKDIKGDLPSVEEIEAEMEREVEKFQKPLDKKLNKLKELLSDFKNEEVKEKQNPQATILIFNEFIVPLNKSIKKSLKKDIIPLFDSYNYFIWTDSDGYPTEEKALENLEAKKKGICYNFKLDIKLQGFKKAGVKAFDVSKQIVIQLSSYSYKCEIAGLAGILLEKLYHQLPDKSEIQKITERFIEFMLDDINQHIEQIKRV